MRRHYTNYFRGLPGVKHYRGQLVTLDEFDALDDVLNQIEMRYSIENNVLQPQ